MTHTTDTGIENPGADERASVRFGARTLRIVIGVLAVLLVAGTATAVFFWTKARAADERRQDRAAAAAVASQFALRMDNFEGSDIDGYVKGVNELLTTKSKGQFNKEFEAFKQVYEQGKATGTGKVLLTGVGTADDDSATVLVVHDASVKSTIGNQERHHRWSVDLVKVKGEWLVDDFTPVN